MKLDPTSNSTQPSQRATVVNGQQTIVSSGHDKAVPKADVVANQSPTKIGISSANTQSPANPVSNKDEQGQAKDLKSAQPSTYGEILQTTPLSKEDQKAFFGGTRDRGKRGRLS